MIYIIILIIIIIQMLVFDIFNIKGSKKWEGINFFFTLMALILISGLRYRIGLDTVRYMQSFNSIPTILNADLNDFLNFGREPLYFFILTIAKSISSDFTSMQVIHAIILNVSIFYFIKKHTKYQFTGILFYYLFCFFQFNFEILRQSLAISVFVLSYDLLVEKKLIKYWLCSFIAFLLHSSAFILFVIPFFLFLRVNKKIFIVFFISFVFGFFLQCNFYSLYKYLIFSDLLRIKAETYYFNSEYVGGQLSLLGMIHTVTLRIFIPLICVGIMKKQIGVTYKFESLIVIFCILVIISMQVGLVSRFTNYFLPFYILLLAEFFRNGKCFGIRIGGRRIAQSIIIFYLMSIVVFYSSSYFKKTNGIFEVNRFYPYHSILSKQTDENRERLFEYYSIPLPPG